uniref:DDE-1 domain-containing protein n=1 Tax=Amphimedon queenslandica TaxID=400682 RepID=A0A1X7V5S5_AMPQE
MEREGTKQVPIVEKEDKREITVAMTITASGHLLPFQVIYQGKTVGCHAMITCYQDWNITQSDSHWSTESTMLEFLDKVVVSYVKQTRSELQLASNQPALALFDVFKAHRCESVVEKLRQNHIHQVFVPAGCTGELQTLDVSVNSVFKESMKSHFSC